MVEDTIKNSKIYPNKRQLWLALPKKMMYQTFKVILEYLKESGKIMICEDGKIIWTWNPKLLESSVPAK